MIHQATNLEIKGIYDAQGDLFEGTSGSGTGSRVTITFEPSDTGKHYIAVGSRATDRTGMYEIKIVETGQGNGRPPRNSGPEDNGGQKQGKSDGEQPNRPASGKLRISGEARVGRTLTSDTSGIQDQDGLEDASFSYQWLGDDADIAGATGSTYTLVDADAGKAIRVRVSFTDDESNHETLTSAATDAVEPEPTNTPAAGQPVIEGEARVGRTLTADTSGIQDQDGLEDASFSYQWLGDDADIAGATGSTYTLVDADAGKAIKVRVSFTDDADNEESLTSAATATVAALPNKPAIGPPTISGTLQVDETLTADTTGIADADGLVNTSFTYQWIRNDGNADTDIEGATASTYTLKDADEGKIIKVRVSFTDDADNEESLTSEATAAVAAKANSPATGQPTISGTLQVDETLMGDVSGIADADGLTEVSYSYQWIGNDGGTDADIQDETGDTYILKEADEGKTIKVRVSFTDDADNEESLTSAATAAVAAKANSPATGQPTISGTLQVDETLMGDVSGIADADGLTEVSYSYQWIGNDGGTDADIQDETGDTYILKEADEGKTIKVRVSFTDDADNEESLTSAATAAVAAKANSPATGQPTISGTLQVDETLMGDVSGIADADGLTEVSYSYQWIGNDGGTDADIQDETGDTYILKEADEGKTIKVRVSFTDDADNEESLTSEATAAVAAKANSPATGLPTISGTAQVGETLTADTSGIADADGLANVSYSYQWVSNDGTSDTEIPNATDSTYTLVADDEGKTIKVRVSFADDKGYSESLTSTATASVVSASEGASGQGSTQNSPATGAPTISGTAQVGESLTADTSGIADSDGLASVSYSYQWIRNDGTSDSDITDATGSSYTLVAADEGNTTKVKVTFTDDADNDETLTSTATSSVAARPNSEAAGAPTISGTAQVGETLTADTTGIADSDGLTSVSYSYQWISNDGTSDTEITGATDSTYTLVAADEGKTIKVRVSFTDDADNDEGLISTATDEVAAAPLPLTVSLANNPASHNGTDVFTFQIRFSEETRLSFGTLRDQAFTVTGGTVKKAKRQVKGSNMGWTITVEPDSNAAVEIVLPTTTDCATTGAICTGEGRKLSNRLEFRVSGPNQ